MSFYNFVNEDKKESKVEQAKRLRADLVTLFKSNKFKDAHGVLEYPDDTKLKVAKVDKFKIELSKLYTKTKYAIKIDGGEVNLNFYATIFPTLNNSLSCSIQEFDFLEGTAELDSVIFKLDKATVLTVLEKSRYKTDCTEHFQKTLSSNKDISAALQDKKDREDAEKAERDAKDVEKRKNVEAYIASAAKKLNTSVNKIVYGLDNKFLEIQEEISDSDLKKVKDLFSKYEFYTVYFDRNSEKAAAEKENEEILNKISSIVKFKFHTSI